MPESGNPQAFNRYSYVYNNPVRHLDPTGHCPAPHKEAGDVVCVSLFIPTELILDLWQRIGLGHGDGRGYSWNSDPDQSKGYVHIYLYEEGSVTDYNIAAAESCTVAGCFGPFIEYNKFTVTQDRETKDITVEWDLLNGVSGSLRSTSEDFYEAEASLGSVAGASTIALIASKGLAEINGTAVLEVDKKHEGLYKMKSMARDPYPALEIYQYQDGRRARTLLRRPETFGSFWGPIIGLNPLTLNDTYPYHRFAHDHLRP